ncbi:hypothetical protein PybrP1_003589 [[Pythium] brassicae (nom. inval.)]|nr:hypothetical protein PybrP1_003589 [[Pythium] brassicae (nom. inval.)]
MVNLRPKSKSAAAIVPGATESFPMPEERIPRVQLSDSDVRNYRELTREVVRNTLEKEMAFRYKEGETLDPQRWKFVKAKERMRIYKRAASSDDKLAPMVLGVGFIEGTTENALYGLHHKTTLEMRTTHSPSSKKRSLTNSEDDVNRNAACEVCARHPSALGHSCRSCKICSAAVCSKCFVKARMLATPHPVRVVCCISCVIKSREFPVDPREPYPLIELNEDESRR